MPTIKTLFVAPDGTTWSSRRAYLEYVQTK